MWGSVQYNFLHCFLKVYIFFESATAWGEIPYKKREEKVLIGNFEKNP